jgi:betaine-aldehyde dehydrogenase
VDTAVKAAHAAWPAWKALPPSERAQYLRRAADVLRAHAEELAYLDAVDTGNPVSQRDDQSCGFDD